MRTNLLAAAVALSDQDLLARLYSLARTERESTAELIAHLTALEIRPSLYLADGYGSLFDYCTRALGLSEDAACTRTKVVRICGRFPVILDGLFSGALTLTAVRLLAPHLTAENHEAVLAQAANKGREDIEALIVELAPRPDVPASVRKLPEPRAAARPVSPSSTLKDEPPGEVDAAPPPPVLRSEQRPIVQALAPQRYRVQFTIGQQARDDLRTVQALLRREIPNGDPAAIFERALALLRKEVEKAKLGKVAKPRDTVIARRSAYENRIRFRTENPKAEGVSQKEATTERRPALGDERDPTPELARQERAASRHIPSAVKRVVWYRDRGQCAFVSETGRRCEQRTFLELHHIQPHAMEGPATAGNIALRCRLHNQYEAELVFGPRVASPEPMT